SARSPTTMYPSELKYTSEHEWVRLEEGGEATVGITDFAQGQLGDVVYVKLPDIGQTLARGDVFGEIESVKTVSDLYAPVPGEVIAVNEELAAHPEAVNQKPHEAWMIRLRVTGAPEGLLDAAAYEALIK